MSCRVDDLSKDQALLIDGKTGYVPGTWQEESPARLEPDQTT